MMKRPIRKAGVTEPYLESRVRRRSQMVKHTHRHKEPVWHCLRDEAKEVRPDAGPRTTQMVADRSPQ
jgi:hypothetical protein